MDSKITAVDPSVPLEMLTLEPGLYWYQEAPGATVELALIGSDQYVRRYGFELRALPLFRCLGRFSAVVVPAPQTLF